jgi:hypothetical protein
MEQNELFDCWHEMESPMTNAGREIHPFRIEIPHDYDFRPLWRFAARDHANIVS